MQWPNNILKYIIGFAVSILIRLIPFRPPNVEPIMATTMPFAKKWGYLAGFFFAALSIILYDLLHPSSGFVRIGLWTWITAILYGLIGIASAWYFQRQKETKQIHYVGFAVVMTLIYDALTGLILSPYLFGMTFAQAFFGQIPFTLNHLLGNIVFAYCISPFLYDWIVNNKQLELSTIKEKIAAKNYSRP